MKYIWWLLLIASVACGQAAQLPTIAAGLPIMATYTPTPTAAAVQTAPAPTPEMVTILGTLNIRELPDTSSAVLGWYEDGARVKVIKLVDGIGCPRWYLVTYRAERAFICAEWTSK